MSAVSESTIAFSGSELEAATPDALRDFPVPAAYLAAHLAREDEGVFGDSEERDVRRSIRVGDVPMPALAPDEVLVAVMASSINYNTVWSATFKPQSTFRFLERLAPKDGWHARHDLDFHVIGSDAAGIVLRTGEGVRRWSVGDRVVVFPARIDEQDPRSQTDALLSAAPLAWGYETNYGGLAHFTVVKASQLLPKPGLLSWEEAASNTLCAMTSYRMVVSDNGARMKQGDIVLIWGATGGVGAYAVQFVLNGGGIPVGVVNSERKQRLLQALGCEVVLRRDEMDPDPVALGKNIRREIRKRLGEDAQIVFDCIGRKTFAASVFVVRRGGTVVTCGSSTGYRHEFDNRHLWMSVKRIVGSHGANWDEAWEANRLIDRGMIAPTLSRTFPLEQAAQAARLVQRNEHVGKIGVLCLAEREGLGIEAPDRRARVGEQRIRLFRDFERVCL